MKVHAYLIYKKLPFRIAYVNPIAPEKTLPLGRSIPVLKIGDEIKCDSHAIGLWLDRLFTDRPLHADNEAVVAADLDLNRTLIPMIFYSVYPQLGAAFGRNVKNTLHLGYCVHKTTPGGLPWGMRYLWPLFIRNAGFIRMLIRDIKTSYGDAVECRQSVLARFDELLRDQGFLAGTPYPTMADISAWPLLVVPYQLRLQGFDDFRAYPNIMRWIDDIKPELSSSDHSPWFVPKALDPLPV